MSKIQHGQTHEVRLADACFEERQNIMAATKPVLL